MKSWLLRSLICVSFFAIGASHVTAAPQVADRNVLVLHSYHKGLSWTESITSGIESVFQNQNTTGLKVHLFHEFMDTKRFEEIDYQELLIPVLKYKADRVHYDLIVSVDDSALQFLFKHREEIFGRPVPVVFCGVNFYTPEMFKGKKNYTGVVEAFAAKDTIDLALKLHPNTKEFVVVGDDSVTSIANNKSLQKVEGDYKDRGIRFRYLTDADIESYRRTIEKLESGSIVLAMLFNRDDRGRYYTFEEAFQRYAGLAKVPVYTYWDFYLNYGTVGGKIISGRNQGEAAASLAIRVLDQVPIETIAVVTESPNEYIFDYNQLQHFGIKLSDLPKSSRIINEPVTFAEFYEKYRSYILGILVLIIFLMAVIMVLSANIRKRIHSEKRLIETNTAYYRFVPKEFLDFLKKKDIVDVQPGDCVRQEMSILFSDIRSFTTLSEGMSPEDNFSFINSYLSYISPAIRNHGGFIDKFIGDAIMALFPGPPESVLQAANEMSLRLIDFNQERSKYGLQPIKIGIGIHRGDLMLGTVGEEKRIDSTVISDAVNLASRLESLTKTFGARIIVSEEVVESLGQKKELFLKRYLGRVNVKGKTKPVVTYEWIEAYPATEKEFMIRTKPEFEEAVRLVEKGRNSEAKALLEKIIEKSPNDHAAQYFLSRVS